VSFGTKEAARGGRLKAGLGSDLVSQIKQVSRSSRLYGLGYLKSAAQAECYRVFDKMVERASREMNEGYGPSDLTKSGLRDEFRLSFGTTY
jgi:hypothetical protein